MVGEQTGQMLNVSPSLMQYSYNFKLLDADSPQKITMPGIKPIYII
jgi:hypothetical protein